MLAATLVRRAILRSVPAKVVLGLGLFAAARWLVRRARRYSLAGKTALVTGGSRGLGLEIARLLVERGANVAIVARSEDELSRALADLHPRAQPRSTQVVGVSCDLSGGRLIEMMVESVRDMLGPIDVLVNNAGMIQVGPLEAMGPPDFEAAMTLHCYAPLHAMLAVRPDMKARGGGRVANVASVGGLVSVPHLLPYSTSKFALMGLSEGMHAALARDNIVVSTIAPGLMRTGSPRLATFKGDHEGEHAWFTVADSLPFLSMSSRSAALRIVRAIEQGDAYVVLGLPAKLAALAHSLAPSAVLRMMGLVNALLPGGTDSRAKFGYESESALAPSLLTLATERAAVRNNET